MAAREKGGRVIFIGNIPYGVSEEQIWDLFGRVGQPLSFRLVYDKETGKPKGFGFLEYGDKDQAAAAVRNLNGHEIMGRSLKVDYSNDNSGGKGDGGGGVGGGGGGRAPPPAHFEMGQAPAGMPPMPNGAASELPPLPQGIDVPPGLSAPDAISKTLQAIPAPQLLDILSQMKTLVSSEPQKATAILQQAPQLSYAIFQALLLLGLVDTNILQSLIQQTPQQPAAPQAQAQPPMPPQMGYQQPPPQQQAYQQPPPQQAPNPYQQQQPYSQPPPQQGGAYGGYQQQQSGYAPTPPTQHTAYQPPPPQSQPQYQQPPPQQVPPPQQQQQPPPAQSQEQLMQTVLSLTREQIMGMAPEAQAQILQLRQQWGAPLT